MRRHAKASSAGSTSGRGKTPHSTLGLAFAVLAASILLAATGAQAGLVLKGSFGSNGTGAGQFGTASPSGLAANVAGKGGASAGDVYAVDTANNRVQQFNGKGEIIRAFGWNVVASGPDNVTPASAVQSVNVPSTVTAGAFTLTFNGQTTGGTGAGNLVEGTNTVSGLITAKGSGAITSGSLSATGVTTTIGKFIVGQPVSGTGIPAGTKVTAVNGTTLTLSAAATATNPAVEITSNGPLPFASGQMISGTGIPAGTTITTASAGSLVLSANAEAGSTGPVSNLSSGLAFNATNAQVQTALTGLSSIAAGNVTVSGGPGASGTSFSITFAGTLANTPVPLLTADSSKLTGGTATVSNTTTGVSNFERCNVLANPTDICQAGTTPAGIAGGASGAGGMNAPQGVAVDEANGNLYLTDQGNRRVDVFSATGIFEGAFGWGVATGAAQLEFCSTTCLTGLAGEGAGEFGAEVGGLAVEPSASPGSIYIASKSNRRVDKFAPVLTGTTVTGASFLYAIGSGVATGASSIEKCTISCRVGLEGTVPGSFSNANPISVAVDASGSLYAVNRTTLISGSGCGAGANRRCYVAKFNAPVMTGAIEDFAPPQLTRTSGNPNSFGVQAVAVDPGSQRLLAAQGNGAANKYVVKEFDSEGHPLGISPAVAEGSSQGLTTTGVKALAIGTEGRMYVADSASKVDLFGPPPAPTVTIPSISGIGPTTATFNATVTPPPAGIEGEHFSTSYRFEYSLDGLSWIRFPTEDIALGDGSGAGSPSSCPVGNPASCNVSRTIDGFLPNRTYQVRLVATTGTPATSAIVSFTTKAAAPTVSGMGATGVTQTTAKLIGFVNPNGEATSYRFEWGTGTSYGKQIPAELEAFAGSGSKAVKVSANISGLSADIAYHFRIVATSPVGATQGDDQEVLTLNEAGLPDDRGYELVSPPDKRPQGAVEAFAIEIPAFQAAGDGEAVAYPIFGGLSDSTAGGNVIQLAKRGATGWHSAQVSAPSLAPSPGNEISVWPSTVKYMSGDLSCVVLEAGSPLTADTPSASIELGVTNLYRRNPDGTYMLLTNTVPVNPDLDVPPKNIPANGYYYPVAGASDDCKHIFFRSRYKFLPGTPSGLYEWEETTAGGVLRDAGLLPDGSVPPGSVRSSGTEEVGFGAAVGGFLDPSFIRSQFNAVSPTGRTFFSAKSNLGKDMGKRAVFMREPNGSVVDVSQSQVTSSVGNARYETASPDGTHVFFAASYNRTTASSNGPIEDCSINAAFGTGLACSLYDYDIDAGTLTDLTATTAPGNTKGAAVEGVVAVDEDGSHVYFAAFGQLVPDQGSTYQQNTASGTINIYLAEEGALSYVTTIFTADLGRGTDAQNEAPGASGNLVRLPYLWSAQTTPDGKKLLFTSARNITGYESGGAIEAYLYSVGTEEIVCVSCRLDGELSVAASAGSPAGDQPIRSAIGGMQSGYNTPRSLSKDGSRVFFTMPDALAPGATEGERNLYEWRKGVVHWLVTFADGRKSFFTGASADGADVFVATSEQLDPHDTDFVRDLYDIKVEGGFPPPDPNPVPCDPAADQCQGPATPGPNAAVPASVTGPGNRSTPKPSCRKGLVRKHGKCVKKKKKAQSKRAHRRPANYNHGGAK